MSRHARMMNDPRTARLHKPFDAKELAAAIAQVAGTGRERQPVVLSSAADQAGARHQEGDAVAGAPLNLDHVYLLGWYDDRRQQHLTSWDGNRPPVTVIVTGPWRHFGPPLWSAAHAGPAVSRLTADQFKVQPVPAGEDAFEAAKRLGGCVAFGWHFDKPFRRGADR